MIFNHYFGPTGRNDHLWRRLCHFQHQQGSRSTRFGRLSIPHEGYNFFKARPKSYFIVIVHLKAAGALSERGDPIDSMIHVLEEMKSSIGTIGVSLTSCSVPGILIEMFN